MGKLLGAGGPERALVEWVLGRLRHGRVAMTYWDGTTRHHGVAGPEVEVTLTDRARVRRLVLNVGLAVGEAYMDGKLVIPEDQLVDWFEVVYANVPGGRRRQPWRRARNVGRRRRGQIAHHYDIGNDYYRLFLGATLLYTCAYFEHDDDGLDRAQQQKVDLLLRKLRLAPGQRLLDIGCGWGHLSVAAAKEHGVHVLGITLSQEQLTDAQRLAEREGVADLVTFRLVDVHDLPEDERFDRVVSVGLLEHIGKRNYERFFAKVGQLLVDEGVWALHTITAGIDRPIDPWVDRYIFPGGHLPTVAGIEELATRHGLWSVDRENLWHHYARTLALWRDLHRRHRAEIVAMFDERFYRMRDFWLAGSEAAFRHGQLGLAQVVMTKGKPAHWPLTRGFMLDRDADRPSAAVAATSASSTDPVLVD